MTEKQDIQIAEIARDIAYIKESLDRNFTDHEEIKRVVSGETVSKARFNPVEKLTYGLAGGVLLWALNQMLEVIETTKALF